MKLFRPFLLSSAALIALGAGSVAVADFLQPGAALQYFIALSGSSAVSLSQRFGWQLTPMDFGAYGDGKWNSLLLTCASGSHSVTFAQNGSNAAPAFSSADIGKTIALPGCGGVYMAYGPAAVVGGGSGYVLGDTITLSGGTSATAVVLKVTGLSGTAVSSAVLYNPGNYSVAPSGTLAQASTSGSGSGATFTLTGFQSFLSTTISGVTSASQITVAANASATQTAAAQWVTWGHDDSGSFNAAVTALVGSSAGGGRLVVPPAPNGMGYTVAAQITLPGNATTYTNSVLFDGAGTQVIIRAVAPMAAVVQKDATYNRGYRLANFQIDGAGMAVHEFQALTGAEIRLSNMWFANAAAGGSDVQLASGAYENFLENCYINDNSNNGASVNYPPTFNIEVSGSDNHVTANVALGASFAQVLDNGPDNHYIENHAYSYPTAASGVHNFWANGASIWAGNTADGSNVSGYWITGYGTHLTGNHAQISPIGYEIAPNVQDVLVVANWSDEGNVTTPVKFDGFLGINTVVSSNGGSTSAGAVPSSVPGLNSGVGNTISSQAGAVFGNYNSVTGAGSFAFGGGVLDNSRTNCVFRSGGAFNYGGDNQVSDCEMTGLGTSGTVNILSVNQTGAGTPNGPNEIRIRTNIAAAMEVSVKLHAFCSTLDYGYWIADFGLVSNKSVSSVQFEGASGLTTTAPTFTPVRLSAGATSGSWAPAIVLDTTNGGAYLTGSGTCTGGKTIYWTADVHSVELASGLN